jgi:hypothetical protein
MREEQFQKIDRLWYTLHSVKCDFDKLIKIKHAAEENRAEGRIKLVIPYVVFDTFLTPDELLEVIRVFEPIVATKLTALEEEFKQATCLGSLE